MLNQNSASEGSETQTVPNVENQKVVVSHEELSPRPHSTHPRVILTVVGLLIISCCTFVRVTLTRTREQAVSEQGRQATNTVKPLPSPTGSDENKLNDEECSALIYKPLISLDLSQTKKISKNDALAIQLRAYSKDYIAIPKIQNVVSEFSSLEGYISHVTYHPETNLVAYFLSQKESAAVGDAVETWIYDFSTGEKTRIFSYTVAEGAINQFDLGNIQPTDLNFSTDGVQLIITSNNAIWLYTIDTKHLEPVYTVTASEANGVFSHPILSADKTKIVVSVGYYEGSSSGVVDVSEHTFHKLPFSNYVRGIQPVGWKGDELALYDFEEDGGHLCWSNWLGENKYCAPAVFPNQSFVAFQPGETLATVSTERKLSRQYLCNNVNSKYQVESQIAHILYTGTSEKTPTDLFSIEVTRSSGMKEYTDITGLFFSKIEGVDNIIVKTATTSLVDKNTTNYFAINPKEPGKYAVLEW